MPPDWLTRRSPRFANRREAGEALAAALEGTDAEIVLALPRGGVPVAAPVAGALRADLRVFLARKVGAPGHEELAIGAVTLGGEPFLDRTLVERLHLSASQVEGAVARARARLDQDVDIYGDYAVPPTGCTGRAVVLIDDGLATGATMLAAAQSLAAARVGFLTVAVPVASEDAAALVARACDRFVCLHTPPNFRAVGEWYDDFRQVETEEVLAALRSAGGRSAT